MNSTPNVIWTQAFSASIAATYMTYTVGHTQNGRTLQLEEGITNIAITEFREITLGEVSKTKLNAFWKYNEVLKGSTAAYSCFCRLFSATYQG